MPLLDPGYRVYPRCRHGGAWAEIHPAFSSVFEDGIRCAHFLFYKQAGLTCVYSGDRLHAALDSRENTAVRPADGNMGNPAPGIGKAGL